MQRGAGTGVPDKWGRKKGAEIGGDEGDMRGGTGVEKREWNGGVGGGGRIMSLDKVEI